LASSSGVGDKLLLFLQLRSTRLLYSIFHSGVFLVMNKVIYFKFYILEPVDYY
jgi:hypothetical protein